MAEHLPRDDTIKYILPSVVAIMKDSVTEVRVSLIENISKIADTIGEEENEKLVIPEIIKLSTDKTWRVRLATIEFIPKLITHISKTAFDE